MAVLSDADRQRLRNIFMRRNVESANFTKAQLRTAINETDAWIDANATAFNNALSQPFRGAASLEQKTYLFCYVAMKRAGLLAGEGD